ncbi:hypothetical protein EGT51_04760 [Levilactobacillus suantsaiihabitans]|uniref:Uncharacterized protein n=1 Tax=Levilactobacillus suantsaiihabitans TaxID=2487722 RepID=A0A4Z0JBH7_9LACO|nr:hypothetical protein EGT51_04760 [Levilactobacillus suantsaiihabitans]
MAPAVSTVLAEVLSQLTAWGDLEDSRVLRGLQANRKPASQAGGVPHSRRNPWQPQATGKATAKPVRQPQATGEAVTRVLAPD